jgi:SAM-dependent methyltransferase
MRLALKITPQRSTQYANMAEVLALPELLASPLGEALASAELTRLGGQEYVLAELKDGLDEAAILAEVATILPRLGATSEGYEYFGNLAGIAGPLLRPLEPRFTPFVPLEMAEVRRYKGKTNELFTRVMLNLAIFAGAYRGEFTGRLRVLDPLAGGGTTLFLALAAGYDAFGIEQNRQDVETTEVFVRQYFHSEHIAFKEVDEKGRRAGRRAQFEVGRKGQETRQLVLVHGETAQAVQHLTEVPGGPRVHAIVGDLPYGIQHFGEIADLLTRALPAWERLLLPGGTLALAWNATRIERAALVQLIEARTALRVRQDAPYTQLAHTVDRVIKKRDLVIAVKKEA